MSEYDRLYTYDHTKAETIINTSYARNFEDFVIKWHLIVLPFLRASQLKGLQLSSPGVVPQREQRPGLIDDLWYYGINAEIMKPVQFDKALERIFQSIVFPNPKFGPVYLMKVDLGDGFYQVGLQARGIPKLALVLLKLTETSEPLVALSLTMPIGWLESPPRFTTVIKIGAAIFNAKILRNLKPQPHRFDVAADTRPAKPEQSQMRPSSPTSVLSSVSVNPELEAIQATSQIRGIFDIHVNNYIGTAQGSPERQHTIRQLLFHTNDQLMRPLESDNGPYRTKPS